MFVADTILYVHFVERKSYAVQRNVGTIVEQVEAHTDVRSRVLQTLNCSLQLLSWRVLETCGR